MVSIPDITIPIYAGGPLVLAHPSFIQYSDLGNIYFPLLEFDVWTAPPLHGRRSGLTSEIGGTCNSGKEVRQWAGSIDLDEVRHRNSSEPP